ncbi:MAG: aryl-sulfate sulfotransferase [Bacteroidetes bacterium]|nr:aryl-sulfate sulfotransferase [Bacteroidota bacterium]MDA0904647.1 aryl-sulfate sulfotransferase [Bacteroidota bacterium]
MFRPFIFMFSLGMTVVGFMSDALSQTPTVGLILQTEASYNGYTLMPVTSSDTTYLINNCGEVVHRWTSSYKAGMMAYLMNNGDLIRAGRTNNTLFTAGGSGGIIERFSWEGDLEWQWFISSETVCQHHDFAVLPNGNVLALAWKSYPASDWIALGRDPEKTFEVVWGTCVIEIQPEGSFGGTVVWKWEAIDHLVQTFDPEKPNYGNPSDFPGKLNANYSASATDEDWLHTNSIAYNAELDQIMISSRDFNELWILDHGTTTEEAEGQGGDLIYRWGNPQAYGRGTGQDQILFSQHDARWIQDGQIMVFSNGNDRPAGEFSTVEIITPPLNEEGLYTLIEGEAWGPELWDWRYPSIFDAEFFSQNTSGAQQLPNGNVLITEGASGEIREVRPSQEMVWNYINPVGAFGIAPQGALPIINTVFRAERYGSAHPGLAGRDLPGLGVIEITDQSPNCELHPEPTCRADYNGNYLVEVSDLLTLLTAIGCSSDCPEDLDDNGAVDIGDLLEMLSLVGIPCSA